MNEIERVNREKISELSIISNDDREVMLAAVPYMKIPYFPISKDFIQGTILNDIEYPSIEGKLSQAATEMKSRINRLVQMNYDFQTLVLEVEELEVQIEEIEESEKSCRRKDVEKRKALLEMRMKQYTMNSLQIEVDSVFKEFQNWKQTVEDCVEILRKRDPNIESFEDVNFDAVRVYEMMIKTQRWRALEQAGEELTPSQKVFVEDQKAREQMKAMQDAQADLRKQIR